MREDLMARAEELRRTGVPFVRATVVRAQRPTSAHAGDMALVHVDGGLEGFVGGTCAEASVREYGLRTLSSNSPLLLRILPDSSEATSGEGSVTVGNPCLSGGALEIFLEPYLPPRRIVIVGDTPIAVALQAFGGPLGWTIEMPEMADGVVSAIGDGVPEALIVASHGRGEEAPLTTALRSGVPYVALVASRRRAAAVLASLDVTDEQRARVHSPAGLDIGSTTAPEIALSILAEFIAERTRRAGGESAAAESPEDLTTATDPVCGMTVVAVPASVHLEHAGSTHYFCCVGCQNAFAAEPERYPTSS